MDPPPPGLMVGAPSLPRLVQGVPAGYASTPVAIPIHRPGVMRLKENVVMTGLPLNSQQAWVFTQPTTTSHSRLEDLSFDTR
jgi:hypothetical protein